MPVRQALRDLKQTLRDVKQSLRDLAERAVVSRRQAWLYRTGNNKSLQVHSSFRSPVIAILIFMSGCSLLALGLSLWVPDAQRNGIFNSSPKPFLTFLGIFIMCAKFAYELGKVSTETVLNPGNPAPILYLRSFGSDAYQGTPNLLFELFGIKGQFNKTPEQSLVSILGSSNPVIAVGKPHELISVPGAYRLYVSNDDWQEVVTDLLRRSEVVVLRAGNSPGLIWEFQTTFNIAPLSRILIWLSNQSNQGIGGFNKDEYETFRSWAEPVIGRKLPEKFDHEEFLFFDMDGQATLLEKRAPSWTYTEPLFGDLRNVSDGPDRPSESYSNVSGETELTVRNSGFVTQPEPLPSNCRRDGDATDHPLDSYLSAIVTNGDPVEKPGLAITNVVIIFIFIAWIVIAVWLMAMYSPIFH